MLSPAHLDFSSKQREQYERLGREFNLTTDKLKEIRDHFIQAMNKGLAEYGSTVPMIPAYVVSRPTGNETGTYLALDLGGTNLRVCSICLHGGGRITVRQRKFTVPENIKVGPGKALFDFLAQCVGTYITEVLVPESENTPTNKELVLGFTFSFPLHQTAIDRGTVMYWNKGFDLPDAVGKDVVQMLQSALHRQNLHVRVTAVVNDTVGCLLANAYRDPNTLIGVIFGTGTNAAYYARIPTINKWTALHNPEDDPATCGATEMIVNTEWGAFDAEREVLPITRFDARLDRMTQNSFKQLFEKMVSGMYLGEIVRLVVLDLTDRRLLFDGRSSDEFNQPYTFDTAYMSEIEADTSENLEETRRVLEDVMGMPNGSTTPVDRYFVREMCKLVGQRAARLGGAALAALLTCRSELLEDKDAKVAVGIDGSLFEHYPGFGDRIMVALREILGADMVDGKVSLALAKDGSGVGAALAAMLAASKREKTEKL
jgi:hexokinase